MSERFVVVITIDGRSHRKLWHTRRVLCIGQPFGLRIARVPRGVVVETREDSPYSKIFEFGPEFDAQGFELCLRRNAGPRGEDRNLLVHIWPAEGLQPVWSAPSEETRPFADPGLPTFVFGCVGRAVRESGLLGREFIGTVAGEDVFRLEKISDGTYRVRALATDLEIHMPTRTLILDESAEVGKLSLEELGRIRISFGACDWHFASAGQIWSSSPIQNGFVSYPRGGPG